MSLQGGQKLSVLRQDCKPGRLKNFWDSTGRKCCNPASVLGDIISRASVKSWKLDIPILVLFLVPILYIGSTIEGGVLPQARVLAGRVSSLIERQWGYVKEGEGKGEWRHQMGNNTTLSGPVDDGLGSRYCPVLESSRLGNFVQSSPTNKTEENYDICLAISIGDDGDQPNNEAVPYPLVSRLLDAVLDEVANFRKEGLGNEIIVEDDIVQVLVGVDYGSVVCAIVRDTVAEVPGVQAKCRTFSELEPSTNFCGKLVIGSSERFVQQVPKEWGLAVGWESRRCVDLDGPDPSHEPPTLPEKDWQPTIVTGFSSNHMPHGLLMLRSLGRAVKDGGSQVNVSVVIWAMEVFDPKHQNRLDCVIDELNHEYGVKVEVRVFNWSAHPSWMRLNQTLGHFGGTGEYAWKAIMVHTVLLERGMVLWADGGDRFKTPESLSETLHFLNSTGFVSTNSQGSVGYWTHPGQLKYFRANIPEILEMNSCEAAIAGFTLKTYREVGRPWYDCSLTRQCIAPDGSDRSNHRQDQAALSLISILSNHPCAGAHPRFGHHADDFDRKGRDPTGGQDLRTASRYLMKQATEILGKQQQGRQSWSHNTGGAVIRPISTPHDR